MKNSIVLALFASFVLMLSGCGSNDYVDGNGTNNPPEAPSGNMDIKLETIDKRVDINESAAEQDIRIHLSEGSIGVADKDIKVSGSVSAGSFLAPVLKTDDAGDVTFIYKAPAPMVDNNFSVKFCLVEKDTVCDTTNINLTTDAIIIPPDPIDDINYFITFVPEGGAYNLALDAKNNAVVSLTDKDTGEVIPDSRIKSIYVKSRDSTILKLTPEGGGDPTGSVIFGAGRNAVKVLMTADKVNSGLAPVEIIIDYVNLNGVLKTRGQLFSIAVLSGAPTAFSINSAGVGYNSTTKQFEHTYIMQATDNSGNPMSTAGVINVSAMASFAKDDTGREMLYGRWSNTNDDISASMTPVDGKANLELSGLAPFNSNDIKTSRAYVAVFGDVDTYEANGKWNLSSIVSDNTLSLGNIYSGEGHADLGMAIGYNYRDKFCTSAYEESVVVVDSTDGTYTLDATGKALVTLKHDAYMIGKRALILVNMTGLDPNSNKIQRMGEVHEDTLSSFQGIKGKTINVPKGAIDYSVGIYGIIDTGTDDKLVLRNSIFECTIELSNATRVPDSYVRNDPTSCDDGGIAFISIRVNVSSDKDGSVVFKNCQVKDEPRF